MDAMTTLTKTESPLLEWWRHHDDHAARGTLSIDDFRLAQAIGRLCLDNPEAREIIQQQREWEKARGSR